MPTLLLTCTFQRPPTKKTLHAQYIVSFLVFSRPPPLRLYHLCHLLSYIYHLCPLLSFLYHFYVLSCPVFTFLVLSCPFLSKKTNCPRVLGDAFTPMAFNDDASCTLYKWLFIFLVLESPCWRKVIFHWSFQEYFLVITGLAHNKFSRGAGLDCGLADVCILETNLSWWWFKLSIQSDVVVNLYLEGSNYWQQLDRLLNLLIAEVINYWLPVLASPSS
jgi:hypothetical protein